MNVERIRKNMSKKAPSTICNRNLWSNNFNNKTKASTIYQQLNTQHHDFSNCRRKFYKTSNATTTASNFGKRYLLTKEKFRKHNTMPYNNCGEDGYDVAGRLAITNINRTLNFKANSLRPKDATAKQKFLFSQNNHSHMQCQHAAKVLNLKNSQRHHCHITPFHAQHYHHHYYHHNNHVKYLFDKSNIRQKTCITTACCKKNDKNHCLATRHNCDKLQLYPAKPSVPSFPSSELREYHCDSPLIWLPLLSRQHQEHLLGMFEGLPPVFLLKTMLPSSSVSIIPPKGTISSMTAASGKYSNHLQQCNLSVIESFCKNQQQYSPDYTNTFMSSTRHPLTSPRHVADFNWNCRKFFKQQQLKSKPTDRDVIFGNACLVLKKPYGWEKSRIEWLLQLEQEQKNNSHQAT